jgi:plastocyanin
MRSINHILALVGGLLAAIAAALLLALTQAGPASAQSGNAVNIVSFAFESPEVTVAVGSAVTWTNKSDRPHTVTDRGGTFDTQPIDPGGTGSVTFSAPGTYFYFCRINPVKMNGVVTVTDGTPPSKAVRVQTIDGDNIEGETLRFDTPDLKVAAGTTLLVANVGGKPHSLTAEDGSFDTGIIQPGAEKGRFSGTNASLTLNTPGTFAFFCAIHPQAMKGTLTVEGSPVAGGPAPPSNAPRQAAVGIADFEFSEKQISVAPGAEVIFTNNGNAPHNATLDDVAESKTEDLESGAQGTLIAPAAPGSYSYKCTIHPKMTATLVVLGQGGEDPVANTGSADPPAAAGGGDDAGGTAEGAEAAAPPPTAANAGYTPGGGAGGGMQVWVIATTVVAALLGGIGIGAFLNRRKAAAAV